MIGGPALDELHKVPVQGLRARQADAHAGARGGPVIPGPPERSVTQKIPGPEQLGAVPADPHGLYVIRQVLLAFGL